MQIQKLTPATKNYLWGGEKLKTQYGICDASQKIAEAWLLSLNKDGLCTTSDGTPLLDILKPQHLGKNCQDFSTFPLLVKLIDAQQNLSVQVHPDDKYAAVHENSLGKTEMWYVLSCEKGAGLYIGTKQEISKEQLEKAIKEGSILHLLNFFEVKAGQSYFIPAGTIHAIAKGCVICEIQQNSNATYRIFDYNRLDSDKNPRQLHIKKATDVAVLSKYKNPNFGKYLAKCRYFAVLKKQGNCTIGRKNSFVCVVILDGSGKIADFEAKKGDCFFIPAKKRAKIVGNLHYLEIFVPTPKKN